MAEKVDTVTDGKAVGPKAQVFFGNLNKRTKQKDGTFKKTSRPYFATCTLATVDALNLQVASETQTTRIVKGEAGSEDYEVTYVGSRNGKTIIIKNPAGLTTQKGNVRTHSIQVPTNATIREIKAFLSTSRAKAFSVKGGRTYSVKSANPTP